MGGGIKEEFVSVKCHPCLLEVLPPPPAPAMGGGLSLPGTPAGDTC